MGGLLIPRAAHFFGRSLVKHSAGPSEEQRKEAVKSVTVL
jgi:hypothetical protein